MKADILAVGEMQRNTVAGVSREVVTVARRLADALGGGVDVAAAGASASDVSQLGADRTLEFEGVGGARAGGDTWATALAHHIRARRYRAVVFAATASGRDLAPRVAAKLASPLLTDITDVSVADGEITATRPVFAGKALADVRIPSAPALLSIRPNVFAHVTPSGRGSAQKRVCGDVSGAIGGYRVQGFEESEGVVLDVSEASIVVSGGRGLKGPENWHLIQELRDALGDNAAMGASRAVVDAGWRPHAEQVGQTGKTVTPKLYVAVGISGAIQHLAGMRTSGVIVAVNRDPDAPIFAIADYGIVGDAFEIVPELAAAIRELRGGVA